MEVEAAVEQDHPMLAAHHRPRKLKVNKPPPGGVRRSVSGLGVRKTKEPSSVRALDRVKSYPDECLESRQGRLFCRACKHDISVRKTAFITHLSSKKHKVNKTTLGKKIDRDKDVTEFVSDYFSKHAYESGAS